MSHLIPVGPFEQVGSLDMNRFNFNLLKSFDMAWAI